MAFESFEPTLVQSLMAESATRFGGRVPKIRREMMQEDERQNRIAEAEQMDVAQRDMQKEERAKQLAAAKIEGESPLMRATRLENQAWNPEKYGDKYRDQFKPAKPMTGEDEMRRRRRLMMSGAGQNDEETY